jgi:hypothetical protein
MTQTMIILGALASGGVLTALIQGFLGRRKSAAESTDVITQAAERAVMMVSSDNARLRLQVDGLVEQSRQQSERITALTVEVHGMRTQIQSLEAENAALMVRLMALDPETFRREP